MTLNNSFCSHIAQLLVDSKQNEISDKDYVIKQINQTDMIKSNQELTLDCGKGHFEAGDHGVLGIRGRDRVV